MRGLAIVAASVAALVLALWSYILGAATQPRGGETAEVPVIAEPYEPLEIVEGAESW